MNVLPIHFTSYSSLNVFHRCPRNLELDKLGEEQPEFETTVFNYGHALGAGVQELFISGDLDKAKFAAFMAWKMDLCADVDLFTPGKCSTNSFPHVIESLEKFWGHYLVMNSEWELFYYEEDGVQKPAVELSAKVSLPNGFYYRIYIDLVLRNKETHELLVLELKSDGMKYIMPEKYANSNQALSYSVILDKIQPGGNSYIIWYAVYYKNLGRWEFFPFPKSRLQKANWIRTVLYDTGNIHTCLKDNFFPKNGENCVQFGRPCKHFGTCELSNNAVYATELTIARRVEKELETKYTYEFTLEEIIEQQLEDIKA
jgi:hypothetical protein